MNQSSPLNDKREWEIEEVMSETPSASVYLIKNTEHDNRRKVLKVLRSRKDPDEIRRILGRVRETASVPNMVKIIEVWEEDGQGYILMPYYHSLYDYQQTHKMTQTDILRLADDLLVALAELHVRGLFHSDVKPENILVDPDGTFLLGDPDSVWPMEEKMAELTKEYAAPEMVGGNSVSENSDLYSLGLVMYRLLNHGRLPFLPLDKQLLTPDQREQAALKRLKGARVYPPAEADQSLGDVLCKALAYAPGDRYPDADAFKKALQRTSAEEKKKGKMKKMGLPAIVLVAAALAAGLWIHKSQAPIAQGSCGASAAYVLSKDEVLTISGSGTCDSYDALSGYADQVKEIVVEPGITDIGYCAFYMFSSLEKVSLPEGLEVIEGSAFYNCYNMEDITFPSTLKSIDSGAFTMCQKLTKIDLPEGFTTLGDSAFDNCVNVTEITLPSTLTSIGIGAFNALSNLKSVEIPDSVIEIGEGAFGSCDSLSEVQCDPKWMNPDLWIFTGTPVEVEQ